MERGVMEIGERGRKGKKMEDGKGKELSRKRLGGEVE